MLRVGSLLGIALALAGIALTAQWPQHDAPDVRRTIEGDPDLDAPAPRTADGTPDLSGVWTGGPSGRAQTGPPTPSNPGWANVDIAGTWELAPSLPYTPYGRELRRMREATDSSDNPRANCLPMGIVQQHVQARPVKYIQTSRELVVLYEGNMEWREIFLDGRSLPGNDPLPWWNGYSVGRWDEDTLVVETTGFRDGGWLDTAGSPLTDAGRIVERFRRPAFGRMEIDITIEDGKAYRRPFTVRVNLRPITGQELIESVCLENNTFLRQRERQRSGEP